MLRLRRALGQLARPPLARHRSVGPPRAFPSAAAYSSPATVAADWPAVFNCVGAASGLPAALAAAPPAYPAAARQAAIAPPPVSMCDEEVAADPDPRGRRSGPAERGGGSRRGARCPGRLCRRLCAEREPRSFLLLGRLQAAQDLAAQEARCTLAGLMRLRSESGGPDGAVTHPGPWPTAHGPRAQRTAVTTIPTSTCASDGCGCQPALPVTPLSSSRTARRTSRATVAARWPRQTAR